jgi:hypothetical protein
METLLIVIMLFIVLGMASLRWGFDSTDRINSPEHLSSIKPLTGFRWESSSWNSAIYLPVRCSSRWRMR